MLQLQNALWSRDKQAGPYDRVLELVGFCVGWLEILAIFIYGIGQVAIFS